MRKLIEKIEVFFLRVCGLNHNCDNYLEMIKGSTDLNEYHNHDGFGLFKCKVCSRGFQISKKNFNKIKVRTKLMNHEDSNN